MKKCCLFLAIAALLFALTACGGDEGTSVELFAMDTVMKLTAYGDGAAEALEQSQREINRLEALLSATRPGSEVSRINASNARPVPVSPEVTALLTAALTHSAATGGAFAPTIAPLVSAWGFTAETQRVPSAAELTDLLPLVDPAGVLLAGDTVTLPVGAAIDLGGIAKGYASDRVAEIYERCGVTSGVISLGGNVYVRGSKPDGSPWRVAIQDPAGSGSDWSVTQPDQSGGYLGTLSLTDAFAITSGGYQRYFEQDGQFYHHILDPATGYPADSGLASVTVVGQSGTLCDAYSTALFVLGEERALELWRQGERTFGLVLATTDRRVFITEDLKGQFQPEEASDYAYTFVS